jgi:hypothetical protein
MFTVWPLMVPVTGADPLLHTVGAPPEGNEIE